MKGFKFRLAGYLRIKEFEEKTAWSEVIRQEAKALKVREKIEVLIGKMEDSKERKNLLGKDPAVTQDTVTMINDALAGQQEQLQIFIKEYQFEMKVLEKLQLVHTEKKRDAKVLEKFKDRKKDEFKVEADKNEQKKLNEISNNIYVRRDKRYG